MSSLREDGFLRRPKKAKVDLRQTCDLEGCRNPVNNRIRISITLIGLYRYFSYLSELDNYQIGLINALGIMGRP